MIEEIKRQIKNDPSYTIGALVQLYNRQTEDEKLIHGTAHRNSMGFNACDAGILTDVCKFYLRKGFLSEKQLQLVRTKLIKYAGQLTAITPVMINPITQQEKKEQQEKNKIGKKLSRYNEKEIRVDFDFDFDVVNHVKSINGRKFQIIGGDKFWTVPFTLMSIDNLIEAGFELSAELQEWYRGQTQGISSDISVPGLDDKLRPFQKLAVSFIEAKGGRALIADSPGLGKTLESIAWVVYRGRSVFPVLIVCPATLKLNWQIEINKWSEFGKDVEILRGTTPYPITKAIAIINYDILYDWMEHIIKEFKPRLIIGDEFHNIKSRGSGFKTIKGVKKKVVLVQRSYAMEEIAKRAQHCIGLTGTPILNRPKEIYNPVKVINPRLFPNFMNFAYRYCDPKNNGFGMDFSGASNITELNQRLTKEVMLRRRKEDVLKELPPKTFTFQYMELDNRREYDKAQDDFIRYLKEYNPEKVEKAKRAEFLVQINHLRKLAVLGKLKQSIQWISDFIENDKLVVFAYHKDIIDRLQKAFPNSVTVDGGVKNEARQKAVEDFQNTDVPLFIGQIQAAGVGITLTEASNMCFIQMPWNPGEYVQCCDRCHRIGQKDAVTIWNLVANDSIDATFSEIIESKARTINAIIDGTDSEEVGIFNELMLKMKNK